MTGLHGRAVYEIHGPSLSKLVLTTVSGYCKVCKNATLPRKSHRMKDAEARRYRFLRGRPLSLHIASEFSAEGSIRFNLERIFTAGSKNLSQGQ